MRALISFRWLGTFLCFATIAGVSGQATAPSQAAQQISQNQATVQAYQQEQRALMQERRSLLANGATQEQLAAWQQQNVARFAAQVQRAQAVATTSALQLRPTNRQPNIPANASPALKDFLIAQATLANSRAQIHNNLMQQASTSGRSLTFAQISKINQQESRIFQQQNAALLTLQGQRSQELASASAQAVRPVPRPEIIPPNATPQIAAYFTTRSQISRGLGQMQNQYAGADPAVRNAAMRTWRQK
jgi:hypothetical protein